MNRSRLILLFALLFSFIFLSVSLAQEEPGTAPTIQESDSIARMPWFRTVEVAPDTWMISDIRNNNMYLAIGEDMALLVDTGRGAADLKSVVESLTDLPVTVVNTHAHGDHCGGNFQFEAVYMHPADFEMLEDYPTKEGLKAMVAGYRESNPEVADALFTDADFEDYRECKMMAVRGGQVFDLGGRKLEVIETPGHTQGCICLLDRKNRLLFSGDNNCRHVYLFMETSLPVEGYLHSLENLMSYSEHFDLLLIGHDSPMGKEYLKAVKTCLNLILKGECEPKPYREDFGDEVMCCTCGRATVAFDPKRLWCPE